jgi:hypothetical protein
LSPDLGEDDVTIVPGTGMPTPDVEFGSFDDASGNPNLPGTLYGVKLTPCEVSTFSFSIYSDRVPAWGDFYARTAAAPARAPSPPERGHWRRKRC